MARDVANRRLRAGIVGGGPGSFIGAVHRVAAELDGQASVIAGAMSRDPQKAQEAAAAWYLQRSYASFQEMAEAEAKREDGIDFVIIATPNYMHFPVAKAFLEQGIHVVCDKPMTLTLEEAQELVKLVESKQIIFALSHNYTGYPAVRQARQMVRQGALGDIRKVLVEYIQDWLIEPVERSGNKQAQWRTDPSKSGVAGCVGDIGTHAENLLEFITGLKVTSLCADLSTFVEGRALDDDANMLLRLENGGKGVLTCSQIAAGEENNLSIRIYGSKAGLEWHQQEPNTLLFKPFGQPQQVYRTNMGFMSDESKALSRLPAGHPEGFYEAFANIYRLAIADIRRLERGQPLEGGYPTVQDGLRGLQFIVKAVESSQHGATWVSLD
ncbi:putative dehydrogenase [Thermosporothrix hazakensis]|jgi:predicted dehydrogenase|uniref:Oxidoreductase n=2 Tax=Thermosporothrix TaxID=768650 RepID=A0A455SZN8_9CHLR|nr:Gfo/Idh/MocA family oxidoreductase [Thermosporothrix hazakensis]PZW31935.1 putative dehydrogenase [Thermosporothrix hazakensis]BBH91595.1 oxidoreductase [Thermosporothrix sp. COM3]GCE49740.1 oxidoreductase [Thermosporothrix hazakensis]